MTGLALRSDGAWDVTTAAGGTLTARRVVNCTGFWGREVGRLAGHDLPLVPVQHQYLVTKSVPEVQAPVMPPRVPGWRASGGQNTACVELPVPTPEDPAGIASAPSWQITWW